MDGIKIVVFVLLLMPCFAQEIVLKGRVIDPEGNALPDASIQLMEHKQVLSQTASAADGKFLVKVMSPGEFIIEADASGFRPVTRPITVHPDGNSPIEIQMIQLASRIETVTVTADVNQSDVLSPDRGEKVFVRQDLLDANPGRPGAPISIPGYPIETASGGIKAPQYFVPGVAGDHGEPIAQYIQVGDFLLQNNLPANAHGNGYADPNLLIPAAIGNVATDAGAFDVRHGNNAVNLAVAYGLRPRLGPFAEISGDAHDYDFVSGWSPGNPQTGAWVGLEIAGGNGFLALPENRKQYKINGERSFAVGRHQLTLFGAGYYGFSHIPGLVPIEAPVPGDTIDPRQQDLTHTSLLVASDTWQISAKRRLQFSGFFRTYSLRLQSDFGDGLIRQSEFRTVAGGNTSFNQQINKKITFSVGLDLRQDTPRNAELSRGDANGIFRPVTLNN